MSNIILTDLILQLRTNQDKIRQARKLELKSLAEAMHQLYELTGQISINIICTHNSRRSQLGQVWFELMAYDLGISEFHAFSGGTEGTAFNHRMVKALQDLGVHLSVKETGDNPVYELAFDKDHSSERRYFSKAYDHEANPSSDFIAMLVCDSADEKCPIIHGATERLFIPYTDPKAADDTEQEANVYQEKVKEMGRELIFCMGELRCLLKL